MSNNKNLENELSKAKEAERRERNLKNEAYSFIMSERQVNKFLDYINGIDTTRSQETTYREVMVKDLKGLWIDTEHTALKRESLEEKQSRRKKLTTWEPELLE